MNARAKTTLNRFGFTFLEVIVALALLAILAVFIGAGMDVPASVAAEADILRSHLGFAQSLAMANNVAAWRISFAAAQYTLERNDGSGWGPSPLHWPGADSATHVLPGDVQIVGGAGSLAIDALGAPAATYVVTLSDGTTAHPVSIVGFTGLVP